jgi:hypothetical protein
VLIIVKLRKVLVVQFCCSIALNPVHIIENDITSPKDYLPSYPAQYDVLAPFPAGSREIVDVLEAFGGILNIPRNQPVQMPSDIIDGGL